jgi:DNA uptake protein ComE-like DNA-binding protein
MSFLLFKDFLKFSKEQTVGIITLFGVIILLQMIYFFVDFSTLQNEFPDKQKWLSLQTEVDIQKKSMREQKIKIVPFNPNFISDYKGYKLGLTVQEIDRLLAFRKQNKFVNSPKEFQIVTQISDSLLNVITPYFKFPNWVSQKKEYKNSPFSAFSNKEKITVIDINQATKEDFIRINGIGEALSIRILNQKEKLGGFVAMEQLTEIWGLSPEVILNLNRQFNIIKQPSLLKINVNTASLKELSQFYYFQNGLARQIVKYRSMYGDFKNIEDMIKINNFPVEKANYIALYLSF